MGIPVGRANGRDQVLIVHPNCQGGITVTDSGSPNIFVNSIPIHRLHDTNLPHTIKVGIPCIIHQTILVQASTTVIANGKGVSRIGDPYSSSERVLTGSENVSAG